MSILPGDVGTGSVPVTLLVVAVGGGSVVVESAACALPTKNRVIVYAKTRLRRMLLDIGISPSQRKVRCEGD